MLDDESTRTWSVAKESYPSAVVFMVVDGLYVVASDDARLLAEQFRIDTFSQWLAFDSWQASSYISGLMSRGCKVILVRDGHSRELTLKKEQRESRKPRGSYLAIDPLLLYDRCELESPARDEGLFEDFKGWLRENRLRMFAEFGEVYVFPVHRWYEVDSELSTMLPHHLRLLAKAALETKTKVPCTLIQPRAHRQKSSRAGASPVKPVTTRLGQLALGL